MTNQKELLSVKEWNEKHLVWILKYCSKTFIEPRYFIWYTDNDAQETDRFCTYKTGDIFATDSLENLVETLKKEKGNLIVFHKFDEWLNDFPRFEIIEFEVDYDMNFMTSSISNNNLDISTLESISLFLSRYDDFVNQDEKNSYLKVHLNDKLIQKTWDYYWDYIFWPRFNDKVQFETWDRPQLIINTKNLLIKFNDLIRSFEERIKVVK
jgi:hypothetical protein